MASGKTRAANLITRNEKVYRLCGRIVESANMRELMRFAKKNTTVILIDDLPEDKLLFVLEMLSPVPFIMIFPPHDIPFSITPEIIITCLANDLQQMRGLENFKRFDFYFFMENKDHEIIMSLQHPQLLDKVYTQTPDND